MKTRLHCISGPVAAPGQDNCPGGGLLEATKGIPLCLININANAGRNREQRRIKQYTTNIIHQHTVLGRRQ